MVEQYDATRVIIRLSAQANDEPSTFEDKVYRIARDTATLLSVDGYNVTRNDGYWKGEVESGSVIEIVTRDFFATAMPSIRDYVLREDLTAFVTVDAVTAFELY